MKIGIPKESLFGERRVAATPQSVRQFVALGYEVVVEKNAGVLASFDDRAYAESGASIGDSECVWQADVVIKINPPSLSNDNNEVDKLREKATLVCLVWPAQNQALMEQLSAKKLNVLAMDAVPRISRAQSLDVLSSMANIAGYRSVVEAAHHFGRFFTGQITAAGKIPPAKVFVAGAGVAGLAAIGTAGSLGAMVRAFDVRPEVKEQVESMGAEFLQVSDSDVAESSDGYAKEMSDEFKQKAAEVYFAQCQEVDIIITTALIPGKPAPTLLTKAMVDEMKAGSVIVDLAAANGGNCEYTQADQVITTENGVTVIGYTDMVSRLPTQSSQLYATNIVHLFTLLTPNKQGEIALDFDDVIIRHVTVVKEGEVVWPAPPIEVSAKPAAPSAKPEQSGASERLPDTSDNKGSVLKTNLMFAAGVLIFGWVASVAPASFLSHFTVFVLACIVGYYVVWNVTHALHTPLMSVTNAISGIIIVGAILQIGQGHTLVNLLSFLAILIASINIFGGFTVTKRMLAMFRKQ